MHTQTTISAEGARIHHGKGGRRLSTKENPPMQDSGRTVEWCCLMRGQINSLEAVQVVRPAADQYDLEKCDVVCGLKCLQ